MSQNDQGRESIESIDQSGDAHEQNPETTSTQGEVAGGDDLGGVEGADRIHFDFSRRKRRASSCR